MAAGGRLPTDSPVGAGCAAGQLRTDPGGAPGTSRSGSAANRSTVQPDAVLHTLDVLLADIRTLSKLPELHRLRAELDALGLTELLRRAWTLSRGRGAAGASPLRLAPSIVDHLRLSDRRLGSFDGEHHRQVVVDSRSPIASTSQTTAATRPPPLRGTCVTAPKMSSQTRRALIRAEADKKRKHLPVRQLLSAAPDVMLAVKPCWAMSPLVVSQLLPSDRPYFDVVIFDEASQVRPAEAIPAILRGKQARRRRRRAAAPPTSFFTATTTRSRRRRRRGRATSSRSTASYESHPRRAEPPSSSFRMLQWHYRSRDERLIAFSNRTPLRPWPHDFPRRQPVRTACSHVPRCPRTRGSRLGDQRCRRGRQGRRADPRARRPSGPTRASA